MRRKEKVQDSLCINIGPYNEFEARENVLSEILSRTLVTVTRWLMEARYIFPIRSKPDGLRA